MQRLFDVLRWTPKRIEHVQRHNVTPEEADEVLADPGANLRRGRDVLYLLFGRTEAGRALLLVLVDETGRIAGPVTARDVTDGERRTYFGSAADTERESKGDEGEQDPPAAGGGRADLPHGGRGR